MLSKAQLQFVRSLHQKKFRNEHSRFIAEGPVLVEEALKSGFKVETIFTVKEGVEQIKIKTEITGTEIIEVSENELQRLSILKQPHQMLALVQMKPENLLPGNINSLFLALDHIADPGNMGTIIRIADWFGIKGIICSGDCVEMYNPKVVQASMGSVFRVNISYSSLPSFIQKTKSDDKELNIYGTILSGKNIYEEQLEQKGIIVMGNETRGISNELLKLIDKPLSIPSYNSDTTQRAESLNVAIAAAIVCSEFRRRN